MPRHFPAVLVATAWLAATAPMLASSLAVLAIGDSMTEEYAFEVPFSAPDSNPSNANARNWVEILRIWRPAHISFGTYEPTAFAYGDWRIAGHQLNFGVPGFTSDDWFRVLATDSLPLFPTASQIADFKTRAALINSIPAASVAVVLIGANDLKGSYSQIFNNTEPSNFFTRIVNRVAVIHDFLRSRHPTLPIVLCTVPDVGVTPHVFATYNEPVRRANARAKITGLADQIRTLAASRGATVADIHALTLLYEDSNPFRLNGTPFAKAGAPENPPDHLFCKDGFHPSTATQALIANSLLAAINAAAGQSIPLLSKREEILRQILGLNPDQPFLDWIAPFAVAEDGPDDNPDSDQLDNLAEYALGTDPSKAQPSPLLFSRDSGRFRVDYQPSSAAAPDGYLSIHAETSPDLMQWTTNGVVTEPLSGGWLRASIESSDPAAFLRLAIGPSP